MFDALVFDNLTSPESLRAIYEVGYCTTPSHYEKLISETLYTNPSYERLEITIDHQIAQILTDKGYIIDKIHQNNYKDFDKNFIIYTVELRATIEDYSVLLEIERSIKHSLNLYDKDIMLEIV